MLSLIEAVLFMCFITNIISGAGFGAAAHATEKSVPMPMTEHEVRIYSGMKPLIEDGNSIMFWRPQKVGSSTIVSILASYGFRFHALPRRKAKMNNFCSKIETCAVSDNATALPEFVADVTGRIPFRISLTHEVCNRDALTLYEQLPCAFQRSANRIKEIMIVREPLSRIISAYYFWGELYRMMALKKQKKRSAAADGNDAVRTQLRTSPAVTTAVFNKVSSAGSELLNKLGTWTSSSSSPSSASGLGRHLFAQDFRLGSTDRSGSGSGSAELDGAVFKGKFSYHGDEATVPPEDIAIAFGKTFPYTAGMPGPSFTWSLFSNSAEQAVSVIRAPERLMTLVTERLDESLVVMRHFLNTEYGDSGSASREDWGLADLVYVTRRKSLSSHPKAAQWPPSAVKLLESKLRSKGEYAVYEAANEALDARIKALTGGGVDVQQEVHTLRQLRERVSELCFTEEYLQRYKAFLERAGLRAHPSANKLRDVEDKFSDGGHEFSLNREILYSFDVCGSCEAHAILLAVEKDLGSRPIGNTVQTASVLVDLPKTYVQDRVQLVNCPNPN